MRYLPTALIIIATLLPTTLQAKQSQECDQSGMSMDEIIACELALLNKKANQPSTTRQPFTFLISVNDKEKYFDLCSALNYQKTITSNLGDNTLSVICYNPN